ncbi:hypothetical protein F8M41_023558 [Gigaspora margarita]|uniref:Uncharacterized protein n=1 Tax=Gigaspora margarita TaxID=4874 RepID=A0A8H4B0Q5_GIGMA|nr:hypothetical protein F8M41_023558 [Gigaspora margarita]
MGRTRRKSVSTRRSAQHALPYIELSEERTNTSSNQSTSNILSISSTLSDSESNIRIAKSVMIENPVDILDHDTLPEPDDHFSSDNENLTDNTSKNELILPHSNSK